MNNKYCISQETNLNCIVVDLKQERKRFLKSVKFCSNISGHFRLYHKCLYIFLISQILIAKVRLVHLISFWPFLTFKFDNLLDT